MNKHELEQLIWATRRDVLNYILGHTWTVRKIDELSILKQYESKDLDNLGIKTETEYQLAKENAELKKEIENLKNKIKVLVPMCCDNINNIGKF